MRRIELEDWVLRIAGNVVAKRPVEDSRVEIKSEWPSDHYKSARQLAGHCNAACGESVLWVFGLDEKSGGVKGVNSTERTRWFDQVRMHFCDLSPDVLDDINIPVDGAVLGSV